VSQWHYDAKIFNSHPVSYAKTQRTAYFDHWLCL